MSRPLRVVVCGTTFGRVHLEALRRPGAPAELVGILARGSARSQECARRCGVPLYREVGELPVDVDAACVAVRAGVVGGAGGALAMALLARGIHVLAEHPVHHDELAGCLRQARRHRVLYRLNNHYLQVPAVRRFIAAAQALYRHGPPRYVDATTGIQVAFAAFDILARALPAIRPWGFAEPVSWPPALRNLSRAAPPLRSLDGVLGGVPLTMRVHNEVDPTDPDNHAHLLHRISIGTDHGNLTLLNTHGPVIWSPRLYVAGNDGVAPPDAGSLQLPSAAAIGEAGGATFTDVLTGQWPQAMATALGEFAAAIHRAEDPLPLGQYHLTVTQVWQDATGRLGQPELIRASPPRPVSADQLLPGGERPTVSTTDLQEPA